MCFQTVHPVTSATDLLEIEGNPNSPNILCASSSDDLYVVDEGFSGVDSIYDTEEFCLDFHLESTEMGIDAESLIFDNETSQDQDTEALSESSEVNYTD